MLSWRGVGMGYIDRLSADIQCIGIIGCESNVTCAVQGSSKPNLLLRLLFRSILRARLVGKD